MAKLIQHFFQQLDSFLKDNVSPNSNALDDDSQLMSVAFQQLSAMGALKLLIPEKLGGLGGGRPEWIEYNTQLAQYSGALLFLQGQHQFAVTRLTQLPINERIQAILESISQSNKGVGVSFAANRQIIRTARTTEGFIVSGKIPWVTGFGYYDTILFSFDWADKVYYHLLPFRALGSVAISPIIKTAVFSSTNTVSITLSDYTISDRDIVASHAADQSFMMEHPSVYTFLGVVRLLLAIASQGKYHDNSLIREKRDVLLNEYQHYHDHVVQNDLSPYVLRAQGYELVQQCISYARFACAAASLQADHPLNRVCREVWVYSFSGYSENQLQAYAETLFSGCIK